MHTPQAYVILIIYIQSNVVTCLKCKPTFTFFSINCSYVLKELHFFKNGVAPLIQILFQFRK